MTVFFDDIMDKQSFKEDPKFLILTSVLVPIFISIIGLTGAILPNILPKSDTTTTPTSQQAISVPSQTIAEESNKPITFKDTYGYLTSDQIISSINSTNITFNPSKSGDSYEVQLIEGEYYLLGFAKSLDLQGIQISAASISDYKNLVALKFKDITSIKKEDIKQKKDTYKVLTINAKSLRADLIAH
ncbi:MAG: hypothetical protein ABI721_05820 [Candidatus Dojkabacteria bacterium]